MLKRKDWQALQSKWDGPGRPVQLSFWFHYWPPAKRRERHMRLGYSGRQKDK
jgi:hypothetical protein